MRRIPISILLVAVLGVAFDGRSASAQMASPDTVAFDAEADSLALGIADSLSGSPGDTLRVVAIESPRAPDMPPADFDAGDFSAELPEGLAASLRRMPWVQLRVHGERGGASYLSVSPIGEVAPELLVEGVPMRSPADLDPSVDDVSSGDLASIRAGDGHFGGIDDFDLRLSRDEAVDGLNVARAQFSSTRRETYYRSFSVNTPRAEHGVRMNFEEWKSELGSDYADLPPGPLSEFGFSKQRRFTVEARSSTRFGRAVAGFGRGRRHSPGSILGTLRRTDSTERWTGQVYGGLDRFGDRSLLRLRLYQVDAREVDESAGIQLSQPQSAGQRVGLRIEQIRPFGGLGGLVQVERWSAVWNPQTAPTQRARGRWIARGGLSYDLQPQDSRLGARAAARVDYAEHAGEADGGGSLLLRYTLHPSWRLEAGAARSLRIPTLLETDGRRNQDYADGVQRDLVGGGDLAIERQDLAHAGLTGSSERWSSELRVESWSLSRGIGQRPVGNELHFVGDVDMRVQQLRARGELRGRLSSFRWSLDAAGHRVLGELEAERGRGSGWPTYAAQLRGRAERPFFSPRNALVCEAFWQLSGPRLDDRMAPLGGIQLPGQPAISATLPEQQWAELRGALRVRDAELYLVWDNPLDSDYSDSFGTLRRPRQLRWGLYWTFYN